MKREIQKKLSEKDLDFLIKEIESRISQALDAYIESEIRISKRNANWASDLAHPCLRYLVYSRLNWRDKATPSRELMFRFREGNDQERSIRRMLENTDKIELIRSQEFFEWEKFQIVGRVDGFVRLKDFPLREVPAEFKSISPYHWSIMTSIEAIKNHKSYWIRRVVAQLNIYLLMTGYELGVLVIKTFGKKPRILGMKIDWELGEELLQKAEKVNEYVRKGKYPDRINYNSEVCMNCGFEHLCMPLDHVQDFIDDEKTLQKLYRWAELREKAQEFQRLDKELKKTFKGKNIIVGGDFEIISKEIEMTIYQFPEEIKKQFAKKRKYWRVEINEL
jgi:CRISPR/Cas system-associated exonuclease Cas4 (RecB family)